MEHLIETINQTLKTVMEEGNLKNPLKTAANYSLFSGGKRLRPLLAVITYQAFYGKGDKIFKPAAALELIHTYSLIHDDLPAMDNDDYRRGQPTLHKVVNEGIAILTGDFFLTFAFELLASDPQLSDAEKIQLIQILSRRSGANGMIGGQLLDIEPHFNSDIETIHELKTSNLLVASLEFGALLAGQKELKEIAKFGFLLGFAFQIADDILDVTDPFQKHGKQVSSDTSNQKITSLSLFGLEGAQKKVKELFLESQAILEQLPCDKTVLKQISQKMLRLP
jgi:geranylgeranyl diphosphate synthase type II